MTISRELAALADNVSDVLNLARDPELIERLAALEKACGVARRAWSGSNIGYHAHVYYEGLVPAPPGTAFVPEWGLMDRWPVHQPDPGWRIMDPREVTERILLRAKITDIASIRATAAKLRAELSDYKEQAVSLLNASLNLRRDGFLKRQLETVEKLIIAAPDVIGPTLIRDRQWTRDSEALSQGIKIAPHQKLFALTLSEQATLNGLETLEKTLRLSATHIDRLASAKTEHEARGDAEVNIQAIALSMLKRIYELSKSRPEGAELEYVAEELDISEGEASVAWNYLVDKRLIKPFSIPTIAAPTAQGIETIENAIAHPNSAVPTFGGVTINNISIQHMSGSTIQQAGSGAAQAQNMNFTDKDREDLEKLAELLGDPLLTDRLDQSARKKLNTQITMIKAQLEDEPDPTIMRQLGKTLRNVTEGAIASLIAAGLQPEVWLWAQALIAKIAS